MDTLHLARDVGQRATLGLHIPAQLTKGGPIGGWSRHVASDREWATRFTPAPAWIKTTNGRDFDGLS
ncbi:hypothetical protein LO772_29555 [Yinghuangia sp. ASG 101]|uniref:hypothetical protein n=1 Tax=Yinghuangia sp. ASG 101 TaxID=2896848 RepID=UPI001E3DDA15|nr:hypothetical protein [Yinghuangia sp. ASG 101]UGQ10918.1 hypothetical protein LO772_29555 [Yinghuangia sp. ASG 101]